MISEAIASEIDRQPLTFHVLAGIRDGKIRLDSTKIA